MNVWERHFFKKPKEEKKNKYKAKRVEFNGRAYASKAEAITGAWLQMLCKNGLIGNIRHQQKVYLTDARIGYIPDFVIWDTVLRQDVYVETKGFETNEWLIKKKLWKFYGPGTLRIYNVRNGQVILLEEIVPSKK
jgi:predicted nuclease of restriction endonuclease-like RecB superfamily